MGSSFPVSTMHSLLLNTSHIRIRGTGVAILDVVTAERTRSARNIFLWTVSVCVCVCAEEVCTRATTMLSRYEVARLVGIRALQISEGAEPRVRVDDEQHRRDAIYVAAIELYEKKMDACVVRDGVQVHVTAMTNPMDLTTMLNTRDGGARVYGSSGTATARTSSL